MDGAVDGARDATRMSTPDVASQGKPQIGVVTDSLAWIPESLARSHRIRIVPLHITFGDQAFTETVDLTNQEFYRRLREAKTLPKTSQPAAGEFLAAYREVAETASAIVSLHASSKMSGTYRSAETGAALLRQERADVRIETIDTQTMASCQGIVVLRAAEEVAAGKTFEEVVANARTLMAKTRILFVPDTLEYLQKGGRIGRAQALVGSLLQIRPILTIEHGEVAARDRARTRSRAMARVLELMAEDAGGRPFAHVAVLHAAAAETAQALKGLIRSRFGVPEGPFLELEIGPVIGTYVGPGAFGVSYHCE